jgi:hypothetical protein
VSFDVVQRQRKYMREIAILEFIDGKMTSLREYWAFEPVGELCESGPPRPVLEHTRLRLDAS